MPRIPVRWSWPERVPLGTTSTSVTMDASGEFLTAVFPIPRSGTITHVGVRTHAVTVSPTNGLSVGLETVDASGYATGTGYKGSAAGTIPHPLSGTTSYLVELSTPATDVVAGDLVAVVVRFAGTYVDGNVVMRTAEMTAYPVNIPFSCAYTGGAWGSKSNGVLVACLQYADGVFPTIDCVTWLTNETLVSIDNGTALNEVGSRIELPVGGRCVGCRVAAGGDSSSGDFYIRLYDAASTLLAQATIDASQCRVTGASYYTISCVWEPVVLRGKATYRAVIAPSSINNASLRLHSYSTAAQRNTIAGGALSQYTGRATGGAWTDTPTSAALLSLVFDDIDLPAPLRTRPLKGF